MLKINVSVVPVFVQHIKDPFKSGSTFTVTAGGLIMDGIKLIPRNRHVFIE